MTAPVEDIRPQAEAPARPRRLFFARLTAAVRRQDWFVVALEVAIVVLGVIIGFQVTAWGQARADAAKEQTYLSQLAADLRETERRVDEVEAYQADPDRAGGQFWAAFYEPSPPPAESLFVWRTVMPRLRIVRPVLGTAEALVATGDLALIRDDSLRSAITGYLEASRYQLGVQDDRYQRWWDALQRVDKRLDPMEAYFTTAARPGALSRESIKLPDAGVLGPDSLRTALREGGYPVPDPFRIRSPLNAESFLSDPEMQNAAWAMVRAKSNIRDVRIALRDDAAALRQQVEALIK